MLEGKTDILITGAGPVGLFMACQLVKHNMRFRIIDQSPGVTAYSGALIIHAGTLELFRQLGLAEEAIARGRILKAMHFSFNGKKAVRLDIGHAGKNQSEYPYALLLEQHKTENILIRFLEKNRVKIERETALTDFSEFSDHVDNYITCGFTDEKIVSSYLVAADGGHSLVRSKLEIPLLGKTHSRSLFATDCKASVNLPENEALIAVSPGATTGLFPLGNGKWRIDGAFLWHDANSDISFRNISDHFKRKTKLDFGLNEPSWFSKFESHQRNALFFNTERCFLVGDAAHLYSPVGAQGMNHGMQDAANLAWKMSFVLKKWAKPCVLYTYEQERKQVSEKTAHISDRVFNVLSSDRSALKFFRLRLLPFMLKLFLPLIKTTKVKEYLFRSISGIGAVYQGSVLSRKSAYGRPCAGERMPFGVFTEGHKSEEITETIGNTRMQIFLLKKEQDTELFRKVIDRFKNQLFVREIEYKEATKLLFDRLSVKRTMFYLVRPDFYIACKGTDAEFLEKYLYRVLIPNGGS
ncbi:MAG TPA: FAD-dependent monooxygenase [Bacteroidales bacterium]|nr:FAD-dependent monooxygenase [Bacteroidales bacterium]